MNAKAWLTIFAVVSVLLLGAAGYFCFAASKSYTDARGSWDNKVGTINSLERKPLYPSEENVEALQADVDTYRTSVDNLFESLNQFQKPLDKTLSNVDFQDLFRTKVNDFRQHAADSNFDLFLEESFQLGFEAYSNSVPAPEIVPILDYELKAIDHVLRTLVASGADSLDTFSRDLIPGEVGGPERQDSGVVHKYPIRLRFTSTHEAFRTFMNSISNDTGFFYLVRVLKIDNEVKEGPPKGGSEFLDSGTPKFENTANGNPATLEDLTKWGYPEVLGNQLVEAARADGFMVSGDDARVLMGQEKLEVFMVIDIVRFVDPSEREEEGDIR